MLKSKFEKDNTEQLSKIQLLVASDVMLERYWFCDANRISQKAPASVVQVGKIERRLGGAANVARNIAALDTKAMILYVVGNDEPGSRVS